MFSAVYNSSHVAWSPGYLAPQAWAPDHLATSALLERNNSHASSSFLRARVLLYVFEDDKQGKNITKQGCKWFRFGNTAVDPLIEG